MKTLTIRKLPEQVADAIRHRSEEMHISFSRALISLLEERLTGKKKPVLYHDLDHLAGQWNQEEAERFDKTLAEQRGIDKELWK